MRRTLIIIAIVIVLAGVGVVAYFYFTDSAGIVVAPTDGEVASLPIAGENGQVIDIEAPVSTVLNPVDPTTGVPLRLVKISSGPVVLGAVVVNKVVAADSPTETTVKYIERQSGNVYSYLVNTGTRTRISNRTIPGIQSATWLPDGSYAFVRYLSGIDYSTINTYALPSVSEGRQGFFLPQNLSDIAVSSTSILTLSSGVNGSVGSLLRTDGTRGVEVFTTPLSSLRIGLAEKNQYLAFTKPSASLPGSAFIVDGSANLSRVAGPLNGLVATISPSGEWILVSYTREGTLLMSLVNVTSREVIPLPVATIADKCVWASDNSKIYCGIPSDLPTNYSYPDDWYQGAVFFSDRIWKIDVSGRFAQFVLDFTEETDLELDASALAIDKLNKVLVFVNKRDGSLWSYSL